MSKKVITLIEKNSNQFTDSDRVIANAILHNKDLISNDSITNVAKSLFISKSSITRFCTKIGLPGFKELKYLLNTENEYEENIELTKFSTIIEFFYHDYDKIIHKIKSTVDEKSIKKSIQMIESAKNIYILGVGSSGFLAQEFSYRMQRLGIRAQAITELHFIQMHAKISSKQDLFICISLTGETESITNAIIDLNKNDCKSILLTEYSNSSSSNISTLNIYTPQKHNLGLADSISNQFGLLLVTDIIYHYLFLSNPKKYKEVFEKTIITN